MLHPSLRVILFLLCLFAATSRAEALTLYAQLFPLSGEVQLRNKDSVTPFPFIYYSIVANNNALNPSSNVWKSISDNYDAPTGPTPGNGFIDATGEWVKISPTSSQLTEGALGVPGGVLPPNRAITLGKIWNSALDSAPFFDVRDPAGQNAAVIREYALAGDYLVDGVVNAADYNLWRLSYGSTTSLLADGSLNGIVDAADYVVWRDNFGMTLSGSGFSAGPLPGHGASIFIGQVPEPTPAFLSLASLGMMLASRSRRRRAR